MKHFLISSISLLSVVGSNAFLYAQKQSHYLPEAQVTAEQPVERLKLLANQPQQYKISFMAGQQLTLKIHSRSTPAFGKLLKKVTPFAVAGIAQRHQTQGPVTSTEGNASKPTTNQFKAGFTMGVGTLSSLTHSGSTRSLATISLYSSFGQLRKTETRWLKSKNETLRIISKKRDGYAVITLQSPVNRQLSIEPSTQDLTNVQVNSRGTGPGNGLGGQPITNGGDCTDPDDPDCEEQNPDFGIESGSGSYSDPYVLSEVSVIAEGTGQTTDYGGGFYFYSGGYYNGGYYEPGYYQDGNYQGGSGSGPAGALDHEYAIEPLNCDAYSALNSYSSSYGKEYGAVITANGQLIILPAAGNQVNKTDFSGVYQDDQGRTIATIYSENGNWYIQTNDFSSGTGQPTVNQITGMIHTHPIGTAPSGLPWDTYNPSGDDLNLLNSYSGLNQYISAPDRTFQYNSSGTIPNSSAPNSCF